jgi:hypothetical protein
MAVQLARSAAELCPIAADAATAADIISSASRIIVLTGAGISVSCGIPDFRSSGGLYELVSATVAPGGPRAGLGGGLVAAAAGGAGSGGTAGAGGAAAGGGGGGESKSEFEGGGGDGSVPAVNGQPPLRRSSRPSKKREIFGQVEFGSRITDPQEVGTTAAVVA